MFLLISLMEYHPVGFGALHVAGNSSLLETILKIITTEGTCFIDTARVYGTSETEIGKVLKENPALREKVFICTKVGINFDKEAPYVLDPTVIKKQCEESFERLNGCIDLLMLHRIDPKLENTEALELYNELLCFQRAGKVKYIGVSECSASKLWFLADTLGVQYAEYNFNPFNREIEKNGVMDLIKIYGIKLIAFGAALRGFLNDKFLNWTIHEIDSGEDLRCRVFETLGSNEYEKTVGFYDSDKIKSNLSIVINFLKLAKGINMSAVDLCISYIVTKGFIPIPGTSKPERALANMRNYIILDTNTVNTIEAITAGFKGKPQPQCLDFLDDPWLHLN